MACSWGAMALLMRKARKGDIGVYRTEKRQATGTIVAPERASDLEVGDRVTVEYEAQVRRWESPEHRAAGEISEAVNNLCLNEEQVGRLLTDFGGTHRTLQQSFGRVAIGFFRALVERAAGGEDFYDLRNAATVALARKVLAAIDDVDQALPLI